MIIFNDRELKSLYTKQENRIIQITSPLSLQEVIQKVLDKEDIDPELISIASFRYLDTEMELQSSTDVLEKEPNLYDYTYVSEDDIAESRHIDYQRPMEFDVFEQYTFGRQVGVDFKTEVVSLTADNSKLSGTPEEGQTTLTYEDLTKELKLATGCLPTLLDQELTYDEMKKYSTSGANLIHPGHPINQYNPCPTIQDIDHFNSMNDYERRLITSGFIHPYKAFTFAQALKNEISTGYAFNTEDYNRIFRDKPRSVEKFIEEKQMRSILNGQDIINQWIGECFQEIHKFTPMVAKEFVEGCIIRDGIRLDMVNKETIKGYVETFNRNSVSKVAKTKSPALLSLTPYINFAEVQRQLTEVLGTYISIDNIYILHEKGFEEWFKAQKNVTPAVLTEVIESQRNIDKFLPEHTGKELLKIAKNKKGYDDCKRFEQSDRYRIYGEPIDFSKNEIAIRGRHTVAKQGNITMRMLPADDYANFTVGIDTNCCQRFGNAGESCVAKLVTDPFAAVVVIEEDDKVKAQGFVWTDEEKDTFVFDNIEFAGNDRQDNYFSNKFHDILTEWVKAIPYKNVHIGTGYAEALRGWGRLAQNAATLPTTLSKSRTYSDYHVYENSGRSDAARAIKEDGQMLLTRDTDKHIEVATAPDEPTKWDVLTRPETVFMLNICEKSIDDRIAFAKAFNENPTPELQLELVKMKPDTIASMENPTREVQLYILTNHENLIPKIKNPIMEVQYHNIAKHPSEILSLENPPEEIVTLALSVDGTLLNHFKDTATYEQCLTAVRNNGMAVQYVPDDKQTEELQLAAVGQVAKALKKIGTPYEATVLKALEEEPSLISSIENPTQEVKLAAIRVNPAFVLDIKNPVQEGETMEEHNEKIRELWTEAVRLNGYLIRNCGKTFPELREVAIRQNPFSIGCIRDATNEEIDLAVSLNPKTALFVQGDSAKAYARQRVIDIHGQDQVPYKHIYQPQQEEEAEIELE